MESQWAASLLLLRVQGLFLRLIPCSHPDRWKRPLAGGWLWALASVSFSCPVYVCCSKCFCCGFPPAVHVGFTYITNSDLCVYFTHSEQFPHDGMFMSVCMWLGCLCLPLCMWRVVNRQPRGCVAILLPSTVSAGMEGRNSKCRTDLLRTALLTSGYVFSSLKAASCFQTVNCCSSPDGVSYQCCCCSISSAYRYILEIIVNYWI